MTRRSNPADGMHGWKSADLCQVFAIPDTDPVSPPPMVPDIAIFLLLIVHYMSECIYVQSCECN